MSPETVAANLTAGMIEQCAARYRRSEELPWLIGEISLPFFFPVPGNIASDAKVIEHLSRALAREHGAGLQGALSYSSDRHIRLAGALRAELRMFEVNHLTAYTMGGGDHDG